MSKVLIISNDKATSGLIQKTLYYSGFTTHAARDSDGAFRLLGEIRFDFLIVDMELKDESGLAFYKAIRKLGNKVPIVMMGEGDFDLFMLTDLSEESYDFIMKPMNFDVLRRKINAIMAHSVYQDKWVNFGDLRVDRRQQLVSFRNKIIQLSSVEIDLMVLLAQKSGKVIHPRKLAKLLESEGRSYAMTTFFYISRLREKLTKLGDEALEIAFIKDEGFKLKLQY